MSDVPPPAPGDLPEPGPEAPEEAGGLWHRYRSLPLWLQIVAPLVVLALLVGGIVWATGGSDGDVAGSDTTTASGDSRLEVVLKGLIVRGALTESSVPTTEAPASTAAPTTEAPASTSAPTTGTPATTAEPTTTTTKPTTIPTNPPTTAPAGPVAPTTTAAPATVPPPTAAPVTTEAPVTTAAPPSTEAPETTAAPETTEAAPETTESPGTTEAPDTTLGANTGLPSVATAIERWNEAASGTDVPTISRAEATELTGQYAGYYLIPLTPNGSDVQPQVGLVGKATSPGSGQLAVVMLAWIPGSDEDSSAFYWESFGVLVQALDPSATDDEIADLASRLGEAPDTPPFTRDANVSSGGLDYEASTLEYEGEAGTLDVSAIAVS